MLFGGARGARSEPPGRRFPALRSAQPRSPLPVTFSVRARTERRGRVTLAVVPAPPNQRPLAREAIRIARAWSRDAPFGWTTLRLQGPGTDNRNRAQFRLVVLRSVAVWGDDFSATRWTVLGDHPDRRGRGHSRWNVLSRPRAADFTSPTYLKRRSADRESPRPSFITSLMHERTFYRARSTPWALVYYAAPRKTRPRQSPFDLQGPNPSFPRAALYRE